MKLLEATHMSFSDEEPVGENNNNNDDSNNNNNNNSNQLVDTETSNNQSSTPATTSSESNDMMELNTDEQQPPQQQEQQGHKENANDSQPLSEHLENAGDVDHNLSTKDTAAVLKSDVVLSNHNHIDPRSNGGELKEISTRLNGFHDGNDNTNRGTNQLQDKVEEDENKKQCEEDGEEDEDSSLFYEVVM